MEIITDWTWLIILAVMTFMLIGIITKIIKSERVRKDFTPNMKVGDKVYSPILNDKVEGEVLEVNTDTVVIKVIVPKNRVYPQK
jgi:preprotein translocase subunit YajC